MKKKEGLLIDGIHCSSRFKNLIISIELLCPSLLDEDNKDAKTVRKWIRKNINKENTDDWILHLWKLSNIINSFNMLKESEYEKLPCAKRSERINKIRRAIKTLQQEFTDDGIFEKDYKLYQLFDSSEFFYHLDARLIFYKFEKKYNKKSLYSETIANAFNKLLIQVESKDKNLKFRLFGKERGKDNRIYSYIARSLLHYLFSEYKTLTGIESVIVSSLRLKEGKNISDVEVTRWIRNDKLKIKLKNQL